ncbi:MAG TPA: type I DNA topoisomerase [Rectinemataceae bacterium]|nr:type I DNA topoisomerase [Rectinemataceae bacterium]
MAKGRTGAKEETTGSSSSVKTGAVAKKSAAGAKKARTAVKEPKVAVEKPKTRVAKPKAAAAKPKTEVAKPKTAVAKPKTAAAKKTGSAKKTAAKKGVLVIVESPAKAKTIEKYLGRDYTVLASMGHLIDLPKSRLGIDPDHDFAPEYLTIRGKAKLLKELQKAAKKSRLVLLASDNDREGEAISWHIQKSIRDKEPELPIERIAFNEITPQAIREAVKAPREIDVALVESQKARRVLDRLVGYNLSPLLWKKVKNGLSAGRVQSVALRLICDREREVDSFMPEEYWTLEAAFRKGRTNFSAELVSWKGDKPTLSNEASARAIMEALGEAPCSVADIRYQEKIQKPKPPFTTSKLQQTAANRLGFTSKKTMQIAQQLYEGVNIGNTRIGLITYMRTDSVRISDAALEEVRAWIGAKHPAELPPAANVYAVGGKAQDAHEAIRPTLTTYTPEDLKDVLPRDQLRLYSLIWERFVASQMTNAKSRGTTIDIASVSAGGEEAIFRMTSSFLVEKGFYKVIKISSSKEDREEKHLPELVAGEALHRESFLPEQHFTQGPSRFTDASIIKALEEQGIGRPSTYAPIISVLLDRYYVTRDNRQLAPTTLGRMINDILVESFPSILDVGFTAAMESGLDRVEEGKGEWLGMLRDFWTPFKTRVDEVNATLQSFRGRLDEPTDIVCEKCGKPMVKKLGRFGFFLACTGFPECRNTRSIPLAKCPRPGCTGEIVARRSSKGRGREFFGCTRYPECDFITYHKPTNSNCPKCGWFLVEKYDKKSGGTKACINPDCDWLHVQGEEVGHGQED